MINQKKELSSTMEDYLETINFLKEKKGCVRVGEIANRLNVKSSSVNTAIKLLAKKGFIVHEKYGYVNLTKEGENLGNKIQQKHDILFRFLTEFLMLDSKKAEKEACCIEHAISHETFLKLSKFFRFLEEGFEDKNPKFLKNFEHYLNTGTIGMKLKCNRKKVKENRK